MSTRRQFLQATTVGLAAGPQSSQASAQAIQMAVEEPGLLFDTDNGGRLFESKRRT
jgi:hypothetical protein